MWRVCNLSNMSIRKATKQKKSNPYAFMYGRVVYFRRRISAHRMVAVVDWNFYTYLSLVDGCVRTKWYFFFAPYLTCLCECVRLLFAASSTLMFSAHFIYHMEHVSFFFRSPSHPHTLIHPVWHAWGAPQPNHMPQSDDNDNSSDSQCYARNVNVLTKLFSGEEHFTRSIWAR